MINLGLDDPEASDLLDKALVIVQKQIRHLMEQDALQDPLPETCEIYRLQEIAGSPLNIDTLLQTALYSACTALTQIAGSISNQTLTTRVALQSLMRVALLGTARTALVLLPTDPKAREDNAKLVLAQDCQSGIRALKSFEEFKGMHTMVPPVDLVMRLEQQKDLLYPYARVPGEGAVIARYVEAFIQAFQLGAEDNRGDGEYLRDHATWLWNTYSGLAHVNTWPFMLPGISPDNKVPGDFPLDLFMMANSCVTSLLAYLDRVSPESAFTQKDVDLSVPLPSEMG